MATIDDEATRRLLAQLTSISAAECEAALADALEEVRRRAIPLVRAMLVEQLLERLDDGQEREPATAPAASVPPVVPDSATPASSGQLVYAYGVTSPDHPAPVSPVAGVGGEVPSMTVRGTIGVITGIVRAEEFADGPIDEHLEDPEWVERNVLAHDGVLRAFADGAAVIPFRFGTIYRSETRLGERLDEAAEVLATALEQVRGTAEWIVTATLRVDASTGVAPSPAGTPAGDGRAYLEARRGDRDRERFLDDLSARCGQTCHDRLSHESVASSLLSPSPWDQEDDSAPQRPILRCAYLVEDANLQGFVDAVGELRMRFDEIGLAIRREGPLPVYHFVPPDVQEAMRG